MRYILSVIVLVALVALIVPTAGAQQPVRDFILLGKNEELPADLAQQAAAHGGTVVYTVPEIGLAVLASANPNFAEEMKGLVAVESVIPNVGVNFYMPGFQPAALPTVNPPWPDDDMFYAFQWNLDAIDAPEAWAQGATGAGVRIAIVDDGLFAQHPDIAPNLNMVLSKSFVPGEPDPFTPLGFPSHSTYVAGIAAAADNGVGIIGVAPEAEIVGVRVVTWRIAPNGTLESVGKFPWMAAGIVYAANIQADVINISLGGWVDKNGYCDDDGVCIDKKGVKELIKLLDRATRYAHKKGSVVIAAAGNDGIDADHNGKKYFLPAQSDKVIAVSATGPSDGWIFNPSTNLDVLAPYSNYGKKLVDFAAPGGNTTFLLQNPDCTVPLDGFPIPCGFFDMVIGPTAESFLWNWAAGTSAAAPHVSGVAALVIDQNGGHMDPKEVEKALRKGADDLGQKGRDPYYGRGRINALGAINAIRADDEDDHYEKEHEGKHERDEAEISQVVNVTCPDTSTGCLSTSPNKVFLALVSNR